MEHVPFRSNFSRQKKAENIFRINKVNLVVSMKNYFGQIPNLLFQLEQTGQNKS